MKETVLGINAFHGDSSACLVVDGRLFAAAEEERFRRIKHWAGFPSEAIRYCLKEAGIDLSDLGHVSVNQDSTAHFARKVAYALTSRPDLKYVLDRLRNQRARDSVEVQLERAFPGKRFRGKVVSVEHHLAHLSSAFHVSPFRDALAVSVDGFGDFSSAAWGIGDPSGIEVKGRVFFPHSLGFFYLALTQYLGFLHYGDEYKVMGLAAYGQPLFMDQMRRIVRLRKDGTFKLDLQYFRHATEKIEYEWRGGEPVFGVLFTPVLEDLLGPARAQSENLSQRHRDIARSAQAMYEEAFFNLLNGIHREHGLDALTLAGGCAMNSVANGKVYQNTRFKRFYVPSAAGDAGGAIGAAFVAWHRLNATASAQRANATQEGISFQGALRGDPALHVEGRFVMDHAYWGPSYSVEEIEAILSARRSELDGQNCSIERVDDEGALCARAAQAVADGQVVGWFHGRMEWGPRALGNRSIIGDPRRADMKNILNLKIKRRESFRPFAPSVLREAMAEWFETDDDVPFMMQVYPIRPSKRASIPAVTHVDGSGRLQTVYRETNPRYYKLIESFRDITGVPMVLNTSFNENEPVVCRPEEALDCFLRTKMDVLVLETWYLRRTR